MNRAILMLMLFDQSNVKNFPPLDTLFRIANNGNQRVTNSGDSRVARVA
jgi:hypothetical protein